jgi:hypothetical protein
VRSRKRYRLERVTVVLRDSRPASWTFAGAAVRGTEQLYDVTDENFATRNRWEFIARIPKERQARVEIRPRATPKLKAWEELPDRSLTFMPATRTSVRGRWYCQVALADAAGERSKAVVRTDQRDALPHWFTELRGRMRRKEAVKPTKGTDGKALVLLVAAGDYRTMIRLFFATKVWILSEGVVV